MRDEDRCPSTTLERERPPGPARAVSNVVGPVSPATRGYVLGRPLGLKGTGTAAPRALKLPHGGGNRP